MTIEKIKTLLELAAPIRVLSVTDFLSTCLGMWPHNIRASSADFTYEPTDAKFDPELIPDYSNLWWDHGKGAISFEERLP